MGESKRQLLFLLIFAFGIQPNDTLAFCGEPSFYSSEPSFFGDEPEAPPSYQRPNVPYCLSSYGYTGTHTCEDYELDAYFDEVNDYIDELNRYYEEALEFASSVAVYAAEAEAFANDAVGHANEVYGYIECEASDVKQQHK